MRPVGLAILLVGAALARPLAASEDDAATVRDYCRSEIAPTGQTCDCLLRQFAKLSERQQALVAAIIRDDAEAISDAREALTDSDAAAADGFLKRGALLCRPSG